jgi:FtsP/CotA-like multicopper oxidase with cupredoxin domain
MVAGLALSLAAEAVTKPVHARPKTAMAMKTAAPAPVLPPAPGCAYQTIDIQKYGMQTFADAPVVRSGANHTLTTTLSIAYTDPATTTIAGCHVHLRTYNGKLVGPTLRVAPGDTMDITVRNDLPPGRGQCPMPETGPMTADLDITNLHTHGLHVSPSGNSDNVFLEICPGHSQQYEIKIPLDQPPGTFWYHAHVHGSTAVQVSSGMEGALIVEGGIDNVPQIKAAQEKTFLLQQISYDEQGQIESLGLFTPTSWPDSKRSVTVNGQIAPVITMRPGEVQRWRFIHGGVRETLDLFVTTNLLNEVATDGNALGRIDAWRKLELDPGYRSDVLFKAPPLPDGRTQMRYYLRSASLIGAQRLLFRQPANPKDLKAFALPTAVQPEGIIAVIYVSGAPQDMALPSDAELAPYIPFKPITPDELTGQPQDVVFSIVNAVCTPGQDCTPCDPTKVANPPCGIRFMVNNRQYPDSPTRLLKLNMASQWTLSVDPSSLAPEHPFHIHVNAFEMTRPGPDGKTEMVWKDTLLVHQNQPQQILSRYEDFTGDFVLHCHILDHEDQGMMERVEIAP